MPATEPWYCRVCGGFHEELPMAFGAEAPDAYYEIPPDERGARAKLGPDRCILDGARWFVKLSLEVPVPEDGRPFVWGLWAEVEQSAFERAHDPAHTAGHESAPPEFGALATRVPGYEETRGLKVRLYPRPFRQFPLARLEPAAHALVEDQLRGIPLARVREYAALLLHPGA
ncbi:MAG: DUF2199 domain-containing protein [Planctomycetota bacterium]|nr:DUF2199 domain-containing protein [Planctomycetota bacterium]